MNGRITLVITPGAGAPCLVQAELSIRTKLATRWGVGKGGATRPNDSSIEAGREANHPLDAMPDLANRAEQREIDGARATALRPASGDQSRVASVAEIIEYLVQR